MSNTRSGIPGKCISSNMLHVNHINHACLTAYLLLKCPQHTCTIALFPEINSGSHENICCFWFTFNAKTQVQLYITSTVYTTGLIQIVQMWNRHIFKPPPRLHTVHKQILLNPTPSVHMYYIDGPIMNKWKHVLRVNAETKKNFKMRDKNKWKHYFCHKIDIYNINSIEKT